MPKPPDTTWRVLSHGPLQQLAENLWCVLGSLPNMSLKRMMTIARRGDGGLLLHSAIALDEPTQRQLEALGPLTHLIVPNAVHRLDAPAYKARYPALGVFTPKRGQKSVEERVPVAGTYEDYPSDDAVQLAMLPGVGGYEGVLTIRSSDGMTLVFNDVLMNMDRKRDPLGFLFTTVLGSAPGPRVSRLTKLMMVKDRAALREELERYAKMDDLVRVIVSHEKVARGGDARAALRKAATYL